MTVTTKDYLTLEETGEANVSIINCIRLSNIHGNIVGAIHRVNPRGVHSTVIFFQDGFAHEVKGFKCGSLTKESKDGIRGLMTILNLIPCLSPHILVDCDPEDIPTGCVDLTRLFEKEDLEKCIEDFISLYFVFRMPSEAPQEIQESDGSVAMNEMIFFVVQNENNKIEEGEW